MDTPAEGEGTTGNNTNNTLSTDELESWTLLDSSPRRSPNPVQMESKKSSPPKKDRPSQVEDDEGEEEEQASEEEEESASEEGEVEQEDEQPAVEEDSVERKTSGVEAVKEKSARDNQQDDAEPKKKDRKKRTDSERSVDSHDGFSSDGISVISEASDGSSEALLASGSRDQRSSRKHQPKVHLNKGIRLDTFAEVLPESKDQLQEQTQLRRKRSASEAELVPEDAIIPWRGINRTSVVVLGVFVTAIAAILVGNSRMYTNRMDEYSFQHEQRISELELENNILKNEMNKLKHLYTQTELDEQVKHADSEWAKVLEEKLAEEQAQAEPEPTAEPESTTDTEEKVEPLTFRKVSPQDEDVKHKVVWSGDDGQPMLIADKDYVLPDFCFNKNAVQDALFSEYTGKYCDIKKRKIEAKLRKAEFARKNHKRYREPKGYAEYIIPTEEEINEYQRQATATPPKAPSLSPFDFDYQKAFETIKEEGAVIVDSLVAILDLDPEPEYLPTPSPSSSSVSSTPESAYQADDEASPSPAPSTESVQQPEIRWESYPPWVKEKYQNQPEMYHKLRSKESLLWDWERKKNNFLHEVGLETLEEVERKSEDELRRRRDEYRGKDRQRQSGEKQQEYHQQRKYDDRKDFHGKKYDERKGGKGRYDERKEWKDRPRNGDDRSHERNNQHQPQPHDQQPWKNDSDHNRKPPESQGESSRQKEWKNDNYSREEDNYRKREQQTDGSYLKEYRQDSRMQSSGEGSKLYASNKKEWNSGERDGKPYHKKEWKESSGDGKRYKKEWKEGSGERGGKPNHKKDWKESSGEHSKKQWKESSGDYSGKPHKKQHSNEHDGKDDWKKSSGEREHWKDEDKKGLKRNGDQWNWKNGQQKPYKDDSGEDFSGEGSYLNQYRGEHDKKHRKNYRDDDDDDDDDDHYKKHGKHHKNDEHWKKKKHHDGDRKWQEHSQERRR